MSNENNHFSMMKTFKQFFHSDLEVITDGKHSLLLLMPLTILLHPSPYADIPKQHWNPMLDSVNPVTSAVLKIQPAQPDNPDARVYVSKAEVWPYSLFLAGHMGKRVQVPCVYNSPPWGIRKLTINDLARLCYFPLLLQEKLE